MAQSLPSWGLGTSKPQTAPISSKSPCRLTQVSPSSLPRHHVTMFLPCAPSNGTGSTGRAWTLTPFAFSPLLREGREAEPHCKRRGQRSLPAPHHHLRGRGSPTAQKLLRKLGSPSSSLSPLPLHSEPADRGTPIAKVKVFSELPNVCIWRWRWQWGRERARGGGARSARGGLTPDRPPSHGEISAFSAAKRAV